LLYLTSAHFTALRAKIFLATITMLRRPLPHTSPNVYCSSHSNIKIITTNIITCKQYYMQAATSNTEFSCSSGYTTLFTNNREFYLLWHPLLIGLLFLTTQIKRSSPN